MLTMTPYTSGTLKSSASFPESPQTSVFNGSLPSVFNFLIRYASAWPFPAPSGRISKSIPPLYMSFTFSYCQKAQRIRNTKIRLRLCQISFCHNQKHSDLYKMDPYPMLSEFLTKGANDFLCLLLVYVKTYFVWPLFCINLDPHNTNLRAYPWEERVFLVQH